MDPFATTTDLEARWRPLSPDEQDRASVLLGDASAILRSEVPDIDTRITADPPTLDPDIPTMIVCAMVKRAMIVGDAEGVSGQMQAAGPYTQQRTFSNPTGALFLSKSEKRLLGIGAQVAFTVPMYTAPCPDPLDLLP